MAMFLATSVSPYMTASSSQSKSVTRNALVAQTAGMIPELPNEAYSSSNGECNFKFSPNTSNQVFSGKFVKRR